MATFEDCTSDLEHSLAEEQNQFFLENFENSVYVDLLLIEDCYKPEPFVISSFESPESESGNPDVDVSFRRSLIKDSLIAFAGEPGVDVDAERIRGIFFLKGEIEGGRYDIEALPASYSPEIQRKYTCSKSLA